MTSPPRLYNRDTEIIYDVKDLGGNLYVWNLQYTAGTTIFNIGHGTRAELIRELEAFEAMVKHYA